MRRGGKEISRGACSSPSSAECMRERKKKKEKERTKEEKRRKDRQYGGRCLFDRAMEKRKERRKERKEESAACHLISVSSLWFMLTSRSFLVLLSRFFLFCPLSS